MTKIVAEATADSGEMQVSNESMGGDPAVLIVKNLRVTYLEDGKEQTVTVREGEMLQLGAARSTPPPAYELRLDAGKPTLYAWQSGKYDLRTAAKSDKAITATVPDPVEITGPWNLAFPPGWDAPADVTFDKLMSWTDNSEFGIKYFSGTVTYTKTFDPNSSAQYGANTRLILDLGMVHEISQVTLNGKDLGIRWWAPYRYDITDAVKGRDNTLVVKVTNLWPNRLIGDEQFPDDVGWGNGETFSKWPDWFLNKTPRPQQGRKTFTTWHLNRKDTPLFPAGLLGPVLLRTVVGYPIGD